VVKRWNAVLAWVGLLAGCAVAPPPRALPPVETGAEAGFLETAAVQSSSFDFAPLPEVPAALVSEGEWRAMGPAPIAGGQATVPGRLVVGAVQEVVPHPANPDVMYVGTVNGGVWKSENASADSPVWRPLTDAMPSLSIGALALDPADPEVLVAGLGRFGSFGRRGGALLGLLRSTDGGATWTALDAPVLRGQNISGVAARGAVILASSNSAPTVAQPNNPLGGVFRSTDTGATFVELAQVTGSGLPAGLAMDMIGDPSNPSRFYVGYLGVGIFRSDDLGETWTSVTDADTSGLRDAILAQEPTDTRRNLEFSVAANGRVYVGVSRLGAPTYIGYSDNAGPGQTFTAMDVPTFPQGQNQPVGVNPGGQVNIHFYIQVDPSDPSIVYVAGDRGIGTLAGQNTNIFRSNGAQGMIVRGDARLARAQLGDTLSPQWVHLVGSNQVPQIPTGGTATGTQPHADHRGAAIDARGALIDANDGGLFRNPRPQDNQGDWTSIVGNLQITEFHDVAYDPFSDIVFAGAQDNGTSQQQSPSNTAWTLIGGGDGGDVQVDVESLPGRSLRYLSSQNLGGFRSIAFDAANVQAMGGMRAGVNIVQGDPLQPQFVTPFTLNRVDPTLIVFGARNGVYESTDRGNNLSFVPGAPTTNMETSIVYGHAQDPLLIVAGGANQVYVRSGDMTDLAPTEAPFPGTRVVDIAIDPADSLALHVIDETGVFRTPDLGASWQPITGNLASFNPGRLSSIEYIEGRAGTPDRLVVGTNAGVYVALGPAFDRWAKLGSGLPNVLVYDMVYEPSDDLLTIGTLGRGTFTLPRASQLRIPELP
jgi:hypothetical protein